MVFESNQKDSSPRFPGLYVGQVMDVATYATSGQIKVSIPSIFDPPTPDNWVATKLCFLFGHFFIPEVGSQVWLAFENGDPRSPVCLGVSYPPGQFPPEAAVPTPILNGVIKTAGGHLINLGGEGSITIQDTKNPLVSIIINSISGTVQINTSTASSIQLGGETATIPVARLGDQGIGNLGAPVTISVPMPPGIPRKVSVE